MIAIIGVLGSAGIAAAQTTPTPNGQNKQAACAKATARLPKIQDRITKVEARIATLQARHADAQGKNQVNRVKFIQARIDWANTVHDHLTKVTNEINTRCSA
jgi:phage shock protein A